MLIIYKTNNKRMYKKYFCIFYTKSVKVKAMEKILRITTIILPSVLPPTGLY